MKLFRSPLHILALMTVLLILILSGYLYQLRVSCAHANITEEVTKVTRDRLTDLEARTLSFSTLLQQTGEPDFLTFDPEKLAGTDISLFIQKSGKIIFWTDNNVPYDGTQEPAGEGGSIIRLDNGWYLIHQIIRQDYTITGLSLVKRSYPYRNAYLTEKFQDDYQLAINPDIIDQPGDYQILSDQGKFLFSLSFDSIINPCAYQGTWAYPLFLITFVSLLLLLLHLHRKLNPFPAWPNASLIAFTLDALIVRGLIFYFNFPGIIHQSYLFSPQLYASSTLNRSLGDMILHAFMLLIIAYAFFQYWQTKKYVPEATKSRFMAILLFLFIPVIVFVFFKGVNSMVFDSTLAINFSNLLGTDVYSLTGLLFIIVTAIALLMALHRVFTMISDLTQSSKKALLAAIPALIFIILLAYFRWDYLSWITALAALAFTSIYLISMGRPLNAMNHTILLMIILSLGITWTINRSNSVKEREHRLVVASNYAQKDDPMAEYLFANAREAMYKDTALAEMLFHDSIDENLVISYILQNFFGGGEKYWSKYNFQVTICSPQQKLVIENLNQVVGCFDFFDQQVKNNGSITMTPNFALIQDQIGQTSYLGILRFENVAPENPDTAGVFIEIFPKIVPVDVGYLELLVDEGMLKEASLNKYANARYQNGQLVASYGRYIYSIDLKNYAPDQPDTHFFFSKGGFSHLYYPTGKNTVLLVSYPETSFLDTIAPFSLFLLVFLTLFAIAFQTRNVIQRRNTLRTNFKNRLQVSLLAVIIASFIMIGFIAVYYISILNRDKNIDNLKDKARSIRIEVEHKLADKAILTNELKPYIQSLLIKFNDVFATDINLFDVQGNLLGSSREKIFAEGLISRKMNTYAYREMVLHKKTLLIHEEQIGELNYLSAYIPFKNNQGTIIAYINLPYFARQSELSDEISSFLMAFINIYLLLIAITIIFTFIISDMIAKPLILIREKIRMVKLGASNERIQWMGYDEISDLVNEYNRMIDELELSAEMLARSERESAWREMARQVAHEIKNPLTPMKLSLQHLEKTMEGDRERWKEQFTKYARVMHQQIESLSEIASAFSDFANMPKVRLQQISLQSAVDHAVALFEGYPEAKFDLRMSRQQQSLVLGDAEQLNRLFINLISNAVQARREGNGITVSVDLHDRGDHWEMQVHDDGKGIDQEIQDKIFLPSFTTKSSGMGLGLAIARSITESMGGTIAFASDAATGTTFTVKFPKSPHD
jgi:two-component system, NtrC family, nitrogen regulation sensor histidine kinase NtrY